MFKPIHVCALAATIFCGTEMTSAPAMAQQTCRQGFVWREAFPGDFVCVPPSVRAQAARDNATAAERRDPRVEVPQQRHHRQHQS